MSANNQVGLTNQGNSNLIDNISIGINTAWSVIGQYFENITGSKLANISWGVKGAIITGIITKANHPEKSGNEIIRTSAMAMFFTEVINNKITQPLVTNMIKGAKLGSRAGYVGTAIGTIAGAFFADEMEKVLQEQSNPIPIKAAMFIAGLIDSLEYRLPLCPPSKENMLKIEQTIKKYDIKGF